MDGLQRSEGTAQAEGILILGAAVDLTPLTPPDLDGRAAKIGVPRGRSKEAAGPRLRSGRFTFSGRETHPGEERGPARIVVQVP